MHLWNGSKTPLFVAEGKGHIESDKEEKVIYLFASYGEAQKKAKELLHQCFNKVSVYRVAE